MSTKFLALFSSLLTDQDFFRLSASQQQNGEGRSQQPMTAEMFMGSTEFNNKCTVGLGWLVLL